LADSALVRETACPSSAEIDFEAVAALRPDLITGVSSGMTAEEYETLSRIAPTVTQTDEYAAHPEWEGREAVVSYVMSESEIGAYASQDIRGQLMTGLGFPTPPEIDELAGDQFFSSSASRRSAASIATSSSGSVSTPGGRRDAGRGRVVLQPAEPRFSSIPWCRRSKRRSTAIRPLRCRARRPPRRLAHG
jgi:hypothetical protein